MIRKCMRFAAIPLSAGLMLFTTLGCQAPIEPTGPTIERVSAPTPEAYDVLWSAITESLRDYSFRIDRNDRGQGVISTHPETMAQGFEFWRHQPESSYDWAEANLATVRRRATVQVRPTATTGEYELEATIQRERYALEERQVDNAAAAMRLYGGDAPTTSGRMIKQRESQVWIAQGRDGLMERSLLERILRECGKAEPASGEPAGSTQPSVD